MVERAPFYPGAGMFVFALVLVFIVLPLAELYVLIQVGDAIGVWWTLALLLADSILGSLLLRAQGRSAWRRFNDTLSAGRPPAREVMDGGLIIFGGAFLITPGFLTDIIGVLLLLPPTRAVFRKLLVRRYSKKIMTGVSGRFAPRDPGARSDYDVEGTAHDVGTGPEQLSS
jgi:UPF0716 protein FxsA